jgi:DNA-binding LytR/AlgR family response regulator
MQTLPNPTALIAEDEPLLAASLQAELARAWPALSVVAVVGDGASAVTQALQLKPDVLFFDIRMPGKNGLDAAAELADAWEANGKPFPALVFVTAYDQYAVQAFETQAVDYLLKPVQAQRLEKTVSKVQSELSRRAQAAIISVATLATKESRLEATLAQLRQLLNAVPCASDRDPSAATSAPLKHIQASIGNTIRLLPVQDVVYFEAADKYIRVMTAEHEYLIRTPLKELLAQLDASAFWQVHRGTVVNASCIDSATRDETGKLWLTLRGRPERLAVSRLYAYLFKAM